ncbi:MAG: hypothetical protein HN919_13075 [Verrucomicrobia bacterium]|jgi:hypothetical protein|nr:hypothetical protein [Verrucomicrobiota bacterium]MBT7067233.1 hypothetical protein [Verrucomicrobiota bacterium]MBT7699014.1 hypothetical protein [Verrucomicrobiota bacterium]
MRFAPAVVLPALLIAAGCAGTGSPPVPASHLMVFGLEGGADVPLPAPVLAPKASRAYSHYQDDGISVVLVRDKELWLHADVSAGSASVPRKLSMSFTFNREAALAAGYTTYACRGWIGCPGGLPPDASIQVAEHARTGPTSRHLALVRDQPRPGVPFVELVPLAIRILALSDTTGPTLEIEWEIQLPAMTDASGPLRLSLCPTLMTTAEWDRECEARERVAWLDELGEGGTLFAELYLNSASDYVRAHLPQARRVHCFLQAAQVRDWYGLVIANYPRLGANIAMTGVRRSPRWQSSNLVYPATGQPRDWFRPGKGVVIDTWRADGGTETKIQSVDEFRMPLNRERLESTVRPHHTPSEPSHAAETTH